ncbi:MAG: hypothetical protein R3E57_10665 [Porticoccaceae bacterium]
MKKILILTMTILSGCAVFDGGKVPPTTLSSFDNNDDKKPTLSYSSLAMGGLSSTKELPESGQKLIEDEIFSELESSAYFSNIAKDDEHADINLKVKLTNTGNPAALVPAVITGLSLYIIPSWATDHFNLTATAERKDGLKKEYALDDSTTLVQWLPMMFVFPFKNLSEIQEVRKNMYRKVLSNMKDDGFFE